MIRPTPSEIFIIVFHVKNDRQNFLLYAYMGWRRTQLFTEAELLPSSGKDEN